MTHCSEGWRLHGNMTFWPLGDAPSLLSCGCVLTEFQTRCRRKTHRKESKRTLWKCRPCRQAPSLHHRPVWWLPAVDKSPVTVPGLSRTTSGNVGSSTWKQTTQYSYWWTTVVMRNIEIRTATNVRVHRSHTESNTRSPAMLWSSASDAFQMHRGPILQRLQGTRLRNFPRGPFHQTLSLGSLLYNFWMNLLLQNLGYWRDSFLDFDILWSHLASFLT